MRVARNCLSGVWCMVVGDGVCLRRGGGMEQVNKWVVWLWPEAGYYLMPFEVEADSEEQALERVVATLVNDGWSEFFEECSEDDEELEASGRYLYMDATMEGASRPVMLLSENLEIRRV